MRRESESLTASQSAERATIGVLLTHPEHVDEIVATIRDAAAFETQPLGRIYRAVQSLHARGETISTVSVRRALEEDGDPVSLNDLVDCMEHSNRPIALQPAHCARTVWDSYLVRTFKEAAQGVASLRQLRACIDRSLGLEAGDASETQRTLKAVIPELRRRQDDIDAGGDVSPLTWGLQHLDDVCPLQPGRLYVVAGLKGGLKTRLLLQSLHENLRRNVPGLFVSLEMQRQTVASTLICREAAVNTRLYPSRFLDADSRQRIRKAERNVSNLPLTIDDSGDLSVVDVATRVRAWKSCTPEDVGVVGVDFLQLVRQDLDRNINEASALGATAYALAKLAKQQGVAIIALAQLNNAAEGQEPHIGHIQGSGMIAQAAEGVLLLDLHSRRDRKVARAERGQHYKRFDIHIEKNRNGQSGVCVKCMTAPGTVDFRPLADRDDEPE